MRDERGLFVKGSTGNPGGRSPNRKMAAEIRKGMKKLCPEVLEKLAFMIRSADADLYVKGVELWLKYNVALPKQEIEHTTKSHSVEFKPELAEKLASLELIQ